MSTVASNTATLCPVNEFLKRVDARTVAQLASDTGTAAPLGSLTSDEKVLAALKDAGGEVEAACLRGGKYTAADLLLLTATDNLGRALLYRIISDLAWVFLWERRPNPDIKPPASLERSMARLDQLADGVRVFPIQENMDAGRIDHETVTAEEVEERNGMVVQADRFFGTRADRNFARRAVEE